MPPALEDRFVGSMLGLALADAIGARYEGGPLGTLVWWAIGGMRGDTLRWTDDTLMATGLTASLIARKGFDADHVAARWAKDCTWRRGYGDGARKMLKLVAKGTDWREANRRIFPDGSLGNGAAMRAAPLGLFFHTDRAALDEHARTAASITHAHPLGVEGGLLIARAAAVAATATEIDDAYYDALGAELFREKIELAKTLPPDPKLVVRRLGNGVRALDSVVTALHAFRHFAAAPFNDLVEYVVGLGGDTDTIGAMAGGLWGALRGTADLPADLVENLEEGEWIAELARELYAASPSS